MSCPLIFNADDYGLSPAVSKGILRVAMGVVRSTTVIANLVTKAELEWLRKSPLKAGAHLNLALGPPLTKSFPRGLLNANRWFDKALSLRKSTWVSRRARSAVAQEWSAQIALLQSHGIKLTHLDSHHHTHLLPTLFPIALDLAQQHGLAIRTRSLQYPAANRLGLATPCRFEEGYFGGQRISRDVILQLLAESSAGSTEVMCHPGLVDATLLGRSSYRFERVCELHTLGEPKLGKWLEQRGWKLCGFDEI